jgi:hypothetical protein
MVLGAMGVVLLGIGAFQFVKASGNQPAAPAAKTAASTTASAASGTNSNDSTASDPASQQNNLVTGSFAYHDPFKPLVDTNKTPTPVAMTQPTPHLPNLPIDKGVLPPALTSPNGVTVPVNPPAPQFGYALAGVILGNKPAAVFIDAQGAQHLVQLGGSLDGDTRLVNLDRDHVVLRVKGQDKNLTLGGGDSSAK